MEDSENTGNKSKKTSIQIINTRQLKAFEMKFKGHTYQQIHNETGYTVKTLETYFWNQGRWYDQYQSWRAYQIEIIQERFADMFIAQATDANQQVVNIAKGVLVSKTLNQDGTEKVKEIPLKGDVVLRAAQDIMDRAGFKAPEKLEVKSAPESIAKNIWDRYNSDRKEKKDE